jgi:undecaprenyl-diphosphatase
MSVKKYMCALLFIALSYHVFSSDFNKGTVYTRDLKKDIIIGSVSLGVFIPPLFIETSPGSLRSKDSVNTFDRALMFSYNKTLDNISTGAQYGMLMLPVISLLGNLKNYNTWLTYGIMYAEAFFLTSGTKDLIKDAVRRNRPYTYFGAIPDGEDDDYHHSFPSGHTSFAFLGATFLSSTFYHEYPESSWKLPVIIGSYTLASGVAAMRIASGNHFLSDVLAGAAIGSLYGWLIPRLHQRPASGPVTLQPLSRGIMVTVCL